MDLLKGIELCIVYIGLELLDIPLYVALRNSDKYTLIFLSVLIGLSVLICIFYIINTCKISNNFDKGFGMSLGLIFLPFVFYPVLGFGKARYIGMEKTENEEQFVKYQPAEIRNNNSFENTRNQDYQRYARPRRQKLNIPEQTPRRIQSRSYQQAQNRSYSQSRNRAQRYENVSNQTQTRAERYPRNNRYGSNNDSYQSQTRISSGSRYSK